MWTFLTGSFIFVGLAVAAFCLGQSARRRFPKTYATVDKILSGIDLILIAVFFVLLYFTR
jgi:hypothetical protein